MATELIPFDSTTTSVPAAYRELLKDFTDEFSTGVSISFPVVSIKGKVFTVKHGEEQTVLTRLDDPDSPASYIDVVVIAANKGLSKAYYKTGYTEGSVEAPDCWSNDGEKPDESVEHPVAKSCKTCPYNQFGSRITEDGKKAKMCSDSKRLAIATPDDLMNPMLLRLPATTLKNWQQYVNMLARKGVPPMAVVTRIKFVSDVAYPQLDFKPVGLLPPEKVKEVQAARQLEVVDYIVGRVSAPVVAAATAATEVVEEVEEAKPAPKPEPKPEPKLAVDEDDEVEEAPKPKATKKPKVVEEDPEVDELLEGLDEL